jgi:Tfp pilus assembly protein PilN
MSTTTLLRTDALPRVNLVPPEIAESARFRSAQLVMGGAVAAVVVAVFGLWYLAGGEVSSAQDQVDQAQSQNSQLQAEAATYANVPTVYEAVDALKAQRAQAMSQEIRYSFLLKDLSLSMPAGVWLTNVTVTEQVDPTTTPPTGAWGTPALGTVTFSGNTLTLPQVAGWLETLGRQRGYTDPYLTTATQTTTPVAGYQFTSSVALTSKALSNRYTAKAGS